MWSFRYGIRRKTVQRSRDIGPPKPLAIGVHHHMQHAMICSRCLDNALSPLSLSGLAYLMNSLMLACNQQISIRMVRNTVSALHTVRHRTQSLLIRRPHQQVTSTIVLVTNALDTIFLTESRIVQCRLTRCMWHNFAHLLDPKTRRRVSRRSQRRRCRRLGHSSSRHCHQHRRNKFYRLLHNPILGKIP